jgi:hypothetical protein
MRHWYNNLDSSKEESFSKKGKCQEDKILNCIKTHYTGKTFTSSMLFLDRVLNNSPVSSYRRAITNLKLRGHIERVEGKFQKGYYGVYNYVWKLK